MKKKYITPSCEQIDLSLGSAVLLNGSSLRVDGSEETNETFSNHKGGWDSSDWSGQGEEE